MKKPLIISDSNILGAKPIVAGTRLTLEFIVENLAAGRTSEELKAQYPELSAEVIKAAKAHILQAVQANNISTYRVPILIRHLAVALAEIEVVKIITKAFENVALGNGPSLRQMEVMDNWGHDNQGREMTRLAYQNLRILDEINNWTALTIDDLNNYDYLSYADGESFRFYIPALMIQGLAQHDCDYAVYKLTPPKKGDDLWDYRMMQFSLMNEQQRYAVARFLWHLLDSHELKMNCGQVAKDAEKALEKYWMPFLEPHDEKPLPKRKKRR